ncbi:MAG: hypothetical protein HQ564_05470 [Candidatus Saganbacteria bacterium]|nr:hypothetical protein [Candidatus Saganbacteria bacterium]
MSNRISIDTRTVKKGDLFIPIKGPNFDGHDFIEEAIKKGAQVLRAQDGKKALQDLAAKHRSKFGIPIIGITGSCGKTTTKDMLASILSQKYPTLKNEENLNNEIGVPLTLLKLRKKHKAAVIEMAVQKPGDMDELVEIVHPTHAIVTNIGEAHIKYFKTKDKIAEEKEKIFKYVVHKPLQPMELKELAGIKLPIPGKHNLNNAAAAGTIAKLLGCTKRQIKSGLEKFKPSSKRMEIIKKNGITIINDTYNANPQSMKAALETLADFRGRKIAVLGDMLELGPITRTAHKRIQKFARKVGVDLIITVGKQSKHRHGRMHFKNNKDAADYLKKIIRPHDIILIKGSRSLKMEKISARVVEMADTYA